MTVIAQASKTVTAVVALLLIPTLFRAATDPSIWSVLWVILGLTILRRVSEIRLTVSHDQITVCNFFRTNHIPLWEAEVALDEPEAGLLLSDSGGKYDQGGRTLYIVRPWHDSERVHVGVAPRYGPEVERIHDELVAEIERRRAA